MNTTSNLQPIALITGASSGLGTLFARELARRGYALTLVARRRERMEALAAEIRVLHDLPIEVIPADLSNEEDVTRLVTYVEGLENLEFLVNNAGFGTVGKFSRIEPHKHVEMLDVHLMATMRLSRAALPAMISRRKGAIVNVSSVAAFFPLPGGVVYCASKAALVAFSQTLAMELMGSGVQVQALCPGFIYTEFHDTPEYEKVGGRSSIPRFMWRPAEPVVSASLRALERGQVVCIPGGLYKLLAFFGRNQVFLPLAKIVIWRLFRSRKEMP
jgi:short-subunit dehydrogenase